MESQLGMHTGACVMSAAEGKRTEADAREVTHQHKPDKTEESTLSSGFIAVTLAKADAKLVITKTQRRTQELYIIGVMTGASR